MTASSDRLSWRKLAVVLRAVRDTYSRRRGYRFASWLRWAVLFFCCMSLLNETATADSVADDFQRIAWLSALFVMTSIDAELSPHRAELQLAVIHGFPRRWIASLAPLAVGSLVFRLIALPVIGFGVCALAVAQSWLPTLAVLGSVLSLGVTACALALALSVLAWIATELAPHHPKKTFAVLVLLPSFFHHALPDVPSVMDMGARLIQLSLLGTTT